MTPWPLLVLGAVALVVTATFVVDLVSGRRELRQMRLEKRRDPRVEKIATRAFLAFGNGGNIEVVRDAVAELREIGAPVSAAWVERETRDALARHMEKMRELRARL